MSIEKSTGLFDRIMYTAAYAKMNDTGSTRSLFSRIEVKIAELVDYILSKLSAVYQKRRAVISYKVMSEHANRHDKVIKLVKQTLPSPRDSKDQTFKLFKPAISQKLIEEANKKREWKQDDLESFFGLTDSDLKEEPELSVFKEPEKEEERGQTHEGQSSLHFPSSDKPEDVNSLTDQVPAEVQPQPVINPEVVCVPPVAGPVFQVSPEIDPQHAKDSPPVVESEKEKNKNDPLFSHKKEQPVISNEQMNLAVSEQEFAEIIQEILDNDKPTVKEHVQKLVEYVSENPVKKEELKWSQELMLEAFGEMDFDSLSKIDSKIEDKAYQYKKHQEFRKGLVKDQQDYFDCLDLDQKDFMMNLANLDVEAYSYVEPHLQERALEYKKKYLAQAMLKQPGWLALLLAGVQAQIASHQEMAKTTKETVVAFYQKMVEEENTDSQESSQKEALQRELLKDAKEYIDPHSLETNIRIFLNRFAESAYEILTKSSERKKFRFYN